MPVSKRCGQLYQRGIRGAVTVGGKREGAGRKPNAPHLKKMPIAVALPQWLLDWMDTQPESRAVLIEEALRKRHKIKPPLPDNAGAVR